MAHLVPTNISSITELKRAFQNASHSVSACLTKDASQNFRQSSTDLKHSTMAILPEE